jgi:hypothetical protein
VALTTLTLTACPADNNSTPTHTHQWGAWAVTTTATCTAKGVETKVCALDATHKETRDTAVNPGAHQWGAWVQTKDPTETQDGEETRTCALNTAHKETRPVAMPELTGGGVTITGETRTGATLTANITAGNGSGARTIRWLKTKDNTSANIGANSASYTLADTGIGHTIKVVVTYANNKGEYSTTAEGEVIGP